MSFLGTYVLRFTATNGLTTASDDLTVSPKFSGRSWGGPGGTPGDFQWHGFKPWDWFDNGEVPKYYLVNTGSGFSEQDHWYQMPYDPDTIMGYIDAVTLGGALVVNESTGVISGNFGALHMYSGNMCTGSSFRGSYGGYTGDTYVEVTSTVFADLLLFYSRVIEGGTSRRYVTDNYPTPPGFLVTYCGTPVWGSPGDVAQEVLSEQMTVEQAAANGGSVEIEFTGRTRITGYNSTTGLATGSVSILYASNSQPSRSGWYLVICSYDKTPLAGGETSSFSEQIWYNVGIGNPLPDVEIVMPMIDGYDVEITSIEYLDLGGFFDDGEQLADDSYFGENTPDYPTTDGWTQLPAFQTDGPGEFWDDGEELEDGPVGISTGGNNWLETGIFTAFDIPGEFWDDAEGYADGEMTWSFAGQGFLEWGSFTTADYRPSMDDGEAYTDGTLTATNGYPLEWISDGSFKVNDYSPCVDDAETYVDGVLTSTDGGDNWLQAGSFQVNT